jgi:hypothetical protein
MMGLVNIIGVGVAKIASAAADTTAPIVTAFTGTASGMTFTVTAFTATDAVGVTGYKITETATAPTASEGAPSGRSAWSSTAQTSVTATDTGITDMYGWAKDAAGNVSSSGHVGSLSFSAGGVSYLTTVNGDSQLGTGFNTWDYVLYANFALGYHMTFDWETGSTSAIFVGYQENYASGEILDEVSNGTGSVDHTITAADVSRGFMHFWLDDADGAGYVAITNISIPVVA